MKILALFILLLSPLAALTVEGAQPSSKSASKQPAWSQLTPEQQKILAETLPRGRLELFAGYGHGVNLLQPERCARASLDFWRTVEG